MFYQFEHRGTDLGLQILCIALHFGAHKFQHLWQSRAPSLFRYSGSLEVGTEDSHIGIAMHGNAVETKLECEDFRDSAMKGVVVDGIATVEQRAVNVEEICVGRVPVKIRLAVDSAFRSNERRSGSNPAAL